MKKVLTVIAIITLIFGVRVVSNHNYQKIANSDWQTATYDGYQMADKTTGKVKVYVDLNGEEYSYFSKGEPKFELYETIEVLMTSDNEIIDVR